MMTCWRAILLLLATFGAAGAETSFALTTERQGNNIRLRWPSLLAENYLVETRSNLSPATAWTTLATNWPATASIETTFTHTNGVSGPAGFYRVARLPFTFNWTGTNFTYSDTVRSFTGVMLKPTGAGPFPAVIVNHGAGGTATGYSLGKARELSAWGMVCIAPTLTHAAGGETNSWDMGFCPENLARIAVCANLLASLAYVDTNRIALFGHSMGAFASIGSAANLNGRLRTAVITSGGIIPDSAGNNNAAPTVTEANPTRTSFLMFHCDGDPVVPLVREDLFHQLLNTNAVLHQRVLYSSNAIPSSNNWHNLHQDATVNADILTNTFQWFQQRGMLP